MYQVRRLSLGKMEEVDELARECGRLYSQTLVSFWRTVRKNGIWLKPKHLMRWHNSTKLHAHTADACVQAFFSALKSWRELRKVHPDAKPPRRRKRYFRIEYKQSAMKLKDGQLRLSNGKGNAPLILDWRWELPQTIVIRWTGTQYEALATYKVTESTIQQPIGEKVCGIDMGEIHMAVAHDGEYTHILNGRLLRSKRQYQNKLKARLSPLIDRKKKGSRRRKKLVKSKKQQLRKIKHQIRDIEHKQTSKLINTLYQDGVQTLVIGDVRDIRQGLDVGSKTNQKLHQWSHGATRFNLTYKAERMGMRVVLQEESYTSKTCPSCGHRRKSSVQGRTFSCRKCGFPFHRDGVGAMNIRYKYREEFGVPHVVGGMAPPTGMRYLPHASVARWEKEYQREAARL